MDLRDFLRRRYWPIFGAISILAVTALISSEFSWNRIEDEPAKFLREWTEAWIPSMAAFAVAVVALWQVNVVRRGQQIEFAPVIRFDLNLEESLLKANPAENLYGEPWGDEDLDWRREKSSKAEMLYVEVHNLQGHPAGSANDLEIDVAIFLPPEPEPYLFTYALLHIAPDATERHSLVDITGLRWSDIEIANVRFKDDSGAAYDKAHGLAWLLKSIDGEVSTGYVRIGGGGA